jgi:hypothetical protein
LSPGECRIIVSLRATGEGHISSIGFRSGVIDAAGEITMDPAGRYVTTPEIVSAPIFDKHTFDLKLSEMGIHNDIAEYRARKPSAAIHCRGSRAGHRQPAQTRGIAPASFRKTVDAIGWLAHSNYVAVFPPDCPSPSG